MGTTDPLGHVEFAVLDAVHRDTLRSRRTAGQIPVVTAAPRRGPAAQVELTLANEGRETIVYTLAANDYEGGTRTVAVKAGGVKTVSWPANHEGYYDVVITANSSDGFRRRYAGRIA